MDLVADGDYLYLGCDGPGAPAGLNIISIENPNNPELVWSLRADVPGFFQVYGVALTENYAISVSYNRGGEWEQNFRIWDRSNPEDLQLVGSRTVEGYYASISILDDYAYVTGIIDRGCLLSVVSIEDPENPELVNTSELPGFAEDSKIQDGFLYISFWNLGFGIFDLENPEQPELIAHYDTPVSLGLSNQLAVTDGYVLTPGIIYDCARVTGRWNVELSAESHDFGVVYLNADSTYQLTISNLAQQDVEILDISCDSAAFSVDFDEAFSIDPGEDANVNITFAPTERQLYNGQLTIQTERRDLTVDLTGTGVPLSTPDDDFQPFKFSIESAYPTPFNSTVNIGYTLDRTGNIRVSIFDLSGRETAVLHDGSMKAGNHSIIWNANNAASGIYVCRIESGSRAKMIKLTLIR